MSFTPHSQEAARHALSSLRRAVTEAEKRGRGSAALLEQASTIVNIVVDAGLDDLRAEAEDLSRRAMKLKVRE